MIIKLCVYFFSYKNSISHNQREEFADFAELYILKTPEKFPGVFLLHIFIVFQKFPGLVFLNQIDGIGNYIAQSCDECSIFGHSHGMF